MPPSIGTLNATYLSAFPMLAKRDFDKYLYNPANSVNLASLLVQLGRVRGFKPSIEESDSWRYFTWTRSNVMSLIDTTGATITGSGSTTVTVAMASALLSGFVRRNYQLRLGSQTAFVQSVTRLNGVATMVIKSVNGNNLTLVAGTKIPVVGNAFSDGAKPAENVVYDLSNNENFIQTFREHDEWTNGIGRQRIEVEVAGQPYYTFISHLQKAEALMCQISNALIAGNKTTNGIDNTALPLADFENKKVQTTSGIDEIVRTRGITSDATTPGVWTLDDIADLEDAIVAAYGPDDYFALASTKSRRPIAYYGKNLTGTGGLTQVRMGVNGREIDMMVEKITLPGGKSLEIIKLPIMDDPAGIGATDISNYMYLLPKGNTTTKDSGVQPRLSLRTMKQYAINGNGMLTNTGMYPVRETHTGGLAPYPTNGELIWNTDWDCELGLDLLVAEHTARIKMA